MASKNKSGGASIASSLPGSTPAKAITLDDSDTEMPTPQVTERTPVRPSAPKPPTAPPPRRSIRVPQDDTETVLSKAQKRKQANNTGVSSSGNSLISRFPYARLDVDQIQALFQVYQIRLGSNMDDCRQIVTSIKQMDRAHFETLVKHKLSAPRLEQELVTLDLDTILNFTPEQSLVIK